MRSILAGEDTVGTKIRAGRPRRIAAYAPAAPWLPPDGTRYDGFRLMDAAEATLGTKIVAGRFIFIAA